MTALFGVCEMTPETKGEIYGIRFVGVRRNKNLGTHWPSVRIQIGNGTIKGLHCRINPHLSLTSDQITPEYTVIIGVL